MSELRARVETMLKSGAKVPKKMLEDLKRMQREEEDAKQAHQDGETGIVRHESLTWVNGDLERTVCGIYPPEEGAWQPAAHGFERGVLNKDNPHGFKEQHFFFSEWKTCNMPETHARLGGKRLLFRIGVQPVPEEGYKLWLQDEDTPGQYAQWTIPFKYVAPVYPHAATVRPPLAPPDSNIEPCLVRVTCAEPGFRDKIGFATAYNPDGTYWVRFDVDTRDGILAIPWWEVESFERPEVQSGFICRVWDKSKSPHDPRRRLEGHFVNRVHKTAGGNIKVEMMKTSLVNPFTERYIYDEELVYEVPWCLKDMTTVEDIFSLEPDTPYLFRSMFAYLFVQDAFLGLQFVTNLYKVIQKFQDKSKEWRPIVLQELLFRVRTLAEKDDEWWDVHTGRCVEIFCEVSEETRLPSQTAPDVRRAVRAVRGFCAATHAVRSHMEQFCKMDKDQLRVQHRNLGDTMMLTHRARVGEIWDNMIALHGDVPMVVEAATTLGYLEPALPEVNPFEREGGFDEQVLQGAKSGKKKKKKKRKKKKHKK